MQFRYFATALFLLLISNGCRPTVEKTTPIRESVSESVYASGVVKALYQYEAFASTSGIVNELFVSEGDSVKTGTPILSIYNESARIGRESAELTRQFADRRVNQTRLNSLEANIDLASGKWRNDSLLYEKQKRLFAERVGTAVELEQRRLAAESARTSYVTALLQWQDLKREIEFNERNASKNLSLSKALEGDLVLRSKVNGKVYALLKEKGEVVSMQTPLAVLGSDKEFVLELKVDEYDIVKIQNGQEVLVTMDSYREDTFTAKVTRIFPIMDERSKSFIVEAVFTKAPPVLYPNLSLEANIVTLRKSDVLTLPRAYLYKERFVITSQHDTVPVTVGLKDYRKVEILDGLDEKTEVILPTP